MSTEEAVATGIRRTPGTVTSAAVVMVAMFAIFVTLRTLDIKQMGFGLAAAILIDSIVVRAVLLPAAPRGRSSTRGAGRNARPRAVAAASSGAARR